MTLAEFLLARIAEDEARADRVYLTVTFTADDGHLSGGMDSLEARVLAECEAKRRIVEEVDAVLGAERHVAAWGGFSRVLELLALPYADHRDYRQEWQC